MILSIGDSRYFGDTKRQARLSNDTLSHTTTLSNTNLYFTIYADDKTA